MRTMDSILIPNHNEKDIESFVQEVVRIAPDAEIIIQNDTDGKGKGWAIREAFKSSTGGIVGFIDGDGDIPPRMLHRLYPFILDYDVVVGSKSNAHAPLHRRIITHLSRIYIRIMFGLKCDTQTGIKLFRREVMEDLWETDGFMFDVEILAKAAKKGYSIMEVPVMTDIRASISKGVLWKTLKESLRIWCRLSFRAVK